MSSSEIDFQFPRVLNCFLLLSIWLCTSGSLLWSNPNTLTVCSAFILRIMFMISVSLCWSRLSWRLPPSLLSSVPASWIPLGCSKFSCAGGVCSHVNVIYITALLYRRHLEQPWRFSACRRAELNCLHSVERADQSMVWSNSSLLRWASLGPVFWAVWSHPLALHSSVRGVGKVRAFCSS